MSVVVAGRARWLTRGEERFFQAIAAAVVGFFNAHGDEIQAFIDKVAAYGRAAYADTGAFVAEHRTECIVLASVVVLVILAIFLPTMLSLFLKALGFGAQGVVEGKRISAPRPGCSLCLAQARGRRHISLLYSAGILSRAHTLRSRSPSALEGPALQRFRGRLLCSSLLSWQRQSSS